MPSDQPQDPATEPSPEGFIRHARPEEAATLGDLALRSKSHWGYDAVFLEACREDLTITADDIVHVPVFVLEEDGRVIGFYALREAGDEALLTDLFVDPDHIGRGHGQRLWTHAVETARHLGFAALTLHSDPYAEGFYRAMGAMRVGVVPSTIFPARLLPLMRFSLHDKREGQGAIHAPAVFSCGIEDRLQFRNTGAIATAQSRRCRLVGGLAGPMVYRLPGANRYPGTRLVARYAMCDRFNRPQSAWFLPPGRSRRPVRHRSIQG